jgi:drug/metabolite transporter (DMT)-like permease
VTTSRRAAATSASAGLLLVAFLWGATFATSKVAVGDVPPLASATLRFGMAALVLLPLYMRERRGSALLPHSSHAWLSLVLLAATAVFGYDALFFGGLTHAPSSDSILLIPTTNPIWTAIFAALILSERVTTRLRIGMVVALGGMALVLLGGPSASFGGDRLLGNLMFIGAAIVFGLSHVMGRIATRHVSPLGATTLAGFIGTLMLLPAALVEGGLGELRSAPLGFWLAISFVAFGGTALGYVLWYRGVSQLGAGNTGFYTNLVPIFGLTLSAIFLGEYPTVLQVAGGLVMLGAVVWATRRPRPRTVEALPVTELETT